MSANNDFRPLRTEGGSCEAESESSAPWPVRVPRSVAFTPGQNSGEWQTWLAHVKSAGTVPDAITDHLEGDGDDPVAVAQAIDGDLSANGMPAVPLSANEYQPRDQQTAGQTAWHLARFAQSGYVSAIRGNWVCCETPNLTGVLTQTSGGWQPNGNWWVMRSYADMTGSLVSTSGEVASTAIGAGANLGQQFDQWPCKNAPGTNQDFTVR